jgi:hypothetical protein
MVGAAMPATSDSGFIVPRQSGASNGVLMLKSPIPQLRRVSTLPENVLQDYPIRDRKRNQGGDVSGI